MQEKLKEVDKAKQPEIASIGGQVVFLDKSKKLSSILAANQEISFTSREIQAIQAHLRKGRTLKRYDYDIELISGLNNYETGIVQLTSKNLGYDFALVNRNVRRRLLGLQTNDVEIFFSHHGHDRYRRLDTVLGLTRVLRLIDYMYTHAAEQHLA